MPLSRITRSWDHALMELRILGAIVFALIVLSGGAAIPFLGFSAVVYLAVFLIQTGVEVWQRFADDPARTPSNQD